MLQKKEKISEINKSNLIEKPDEKLLNQVETSIVNTIPKEEIVQNDNEKPIIDVSEPKVLTASIFPKKFKPKILDDLDEIRMKHEKMLEHKVPEDKLFSVEDKTGNIIFRDPNPAERKFIGGVLQELNMGTLAPIKNKVLFKVDDLFSSKNSLVEFQDMVYTVFKKQIDEAKQGKKSVDEIAAAAAKLNRADVYVKILKRKPGEMLDLVTFYRALTETMIMNVETKRLASAFLKNDTPETYMAFLKSFRLYGALFAQTAGSTSELGRGLVITRYLDTPSMAGVTDFETIMKMMNGNLDLKKGKQIATAFMSLAPYQQSKFAQQGFIGKLGDVWAELWVNSLLASPITHAVNMTANVGFNVLRLTEFAIAAGINKIPGLASRDGVMFSEVIEMIAGMNYGTKLGLANGFHALKTGDAVTTKMDLRHPKALTEDLAGKYSDTAFGSVLKYMGHWFRLPGRLLVTEDEFMKGIVFRMEIDRIARRKYNQAIADGLDVKTAEAIRVESLINPDVATVKSAKDAMLEGTFQKDLPPGFFKNIQKNINHPAAKLFIPFYRTIMNIFFESNKRNPFMMVLGYLSPTDVGKSIRKNLHGGNGKVAQQLTMAKLATGGTIMWQFGTMAYGASTTGDQKIMITGMAPLKRAEREVFFRKGFQPYSIAVLNSKTGMYTSYSYSRMDPISSLLAISADFAYLATRPDQWGNDKNLTTLIETFSTGVLAIYPYLTEQPFLTGLKEFSKVFSPAFGDDESAMHRIVAELTAKVTQGSVGLVAGLGVPQSFGNYLRKMSDKTIYQSNLMTEDQSIFAREFFGSEVPPFVIAFYKEYNKAMLASPWFNNDLEPRLNFWAEKMEGPETGVISPIKIMDEKWNEVDDWLLKNGFGFPMPRASIEGIQMNGSEYNNFIQFMNIDLDESGESDMLEELAELIMQPNFRKKESGEKIRDLNTIVSFYKIRAKNLFYDAYPDFEARVNDLKEIRQSTGKR